jgi:hypothetical protein
MQQYLNAINGLRPGAAPAASSAAAAAPAVPAVPVAAGRARVIPAASSVPAAAPARTRQQQHKKDQEDVEDLFDRMTVDRKHRAQKKRENPLDTRYLRQRGKELKKKQDEESQMDVSGLGATRKRTSHMVKMDKEQEKKENAMDLSGTWKIYGPTTLMIQKQRESEKRQKEAQRAFEKQQKDAQRALEKQQKEAQRALEKQQRAEDKAERERQREQQRAEKEEERERMRAEKEAEREHKNQYGADPFYKNLKQLPPRADPHPLFPPPDVPAALNTSLQALAAKSTRWPDSDDSGGDSDDDDSDATLDNASVFFKVEAPWGVIVKFITLLVRSLDLPMPSVFFGAVFHAAVKYLSTKYPTVDTQRTWLHRNLLDFLTSFVVQVNWAIEKAFACVRHATQDHVPSLTLLDIISNTHAVQHFVDVCFHVYTDGNINRGKKYQPAEVTLFSESAKDADMSFFEAMSTRPAANIDGEAQFASTAKQKNVVDMLDEEAPADYLPGWLPMEADAEGVKITKPGAANPSGADVLRHYRKKQQTGNAAESRFPTDSPPYSFDRSGDHYSIPRFGYFMRLVLQACCLSGSAKEPKDIFFEESYASERDMNLTEQFLTDKSSACANAMRKALILIQERSLDVLFPDTPWVRVVMWLLADRTRAIQAVQVISIEHNLERILARTSNTITPVVVRRMQMSREGILRWFAERFNTSGYKGFYDPITWTSSRKAWTPATLAPRVPPQPLLPHPVEDFPSRVEGLSVLDLYDE